MKKRFVIAAMALSAAMTISMAGCGAGTGAGQNTQEKQEAAEEEENYDTGDASKDDPRNADDIGDNELMVVSFGTSFNDSRRLSIGAIEEDMEADFPQYSVRRAFTSQIIIDHVKERDGEEIDNMKEALDRAADNKVKNLVVQPTHLMNGIEYEEMTEEIGNYSDAFENVAIGEPLLTSDEDFEAVASAMIGVTEEYDDGDTAIVFMGHGTEADSNKVYSKMQDVLTDMGKTNYIIGTVEAEPGIDDVIKAIKDGGYKKAVLRPMMVVAGDHANNDMAGDEEDSWKSKIEAEGIETECVLEGLGEVPAIRKLYETHAAEAVESINKDSKVADKSDMAKGQEVGFEGMSPVFVSDIKEGEYDISVDSSSSMFKIEACRLTVKKDSMEAVMTMSGTGYRYICQGTPALAANTDEKNYIKPVEDKDKKHTFTIPVAALDAKLPVSAFSDKKEKWYGRTLVFRADSLPEGAVEKEAGKTAEDLGLKDGEYKVEVALEGGSGRASVTSPAKLTVKDGKAVADIEWSSPHYDYMKIGDEKYDPVNTEGNSVFEIPVSAFDSPMKVIGDTTAMSKPHEIEYTLTFDSSSIK